MGKYIKMRSRKTHRQYNTETETTVLLYFGY